MPTPRVCEWKRYVIIYVYINNPRHVVGGLHPETTLVVSHESLPLSLFLSPTRPPHPPPSFSLPAPRQAPRGPCPALIHPLSTTHTHSPLPLPPLPLLPDPDPDPHPPTRTRALQISSGEPIDMKRLELFMFTYPRMLGLRSFRNLTQLQIMQQEVRRMSLFTRVVVVGVGREGSREADGRDTC